MHRHDIGHDSHEVAGAKRRVAGRAAFILTAATLLVGIAAGALLSATAEAKQGDRRDRARQGVVRGRELPVAMPTITVPDFRAVAKLVIPSVVTVRSTREIERGQNPHASGGPLDDFMERFFGGRGGPERGGGEARKQRGLGSGVIVTTDGYILTNNHVVENSEVEIVTADGDVHKATIVGTDPKSDLAVLKVDADGLRAIRMGNSDVLEVGEWVLAVGNPFSESLGHTVTHGIVSGTGRTRLALAEYEDFIQTDAAVNPGNSGGALVNTAGELIGINTAIVSRSGGYQGVSFAIPVNMAQNVMDQLVATGKVSRGYLGVNIQDLTSDIAAGLGLDREDGVLVSNVFDGTPASRAGLERGDVIVRLDGEPVKDTNQLRNKIASTPPGTTVRMRVIRGGRTKGISLTLAELPESGTAPFTSGPSEPDTAEAIGVTVRELTDDVAAQLGYDGETGVVITRVEPSSPAAEAGLRQGDLIKEVNRRSVRRLADYREAIAGLQKDRVILLYLRRGNGSQYVTIRP